MAIEQFEDLPEEDELGMTPAIKGPANVVLAVTATAACGAVAAALVLFA